MGDWTSTPDVTVSIYEAVMNTNVRGPMFLVKAVLPHMPRGGRIVNISSFAARTIMMGPGIPDLALYSASKVALEGLTRGWAAEVRYIATYHE
jgi:3-oxoacyl-[acyl-carrier protein] reductase